MLYSCADYGLLHYQSAFYRRARSKLQGVESYGYTAQGLSVRRERKKEEERERQRQKERERERRGVSNIGGSLRGRN